MEILCELTAEISGRDVIVGPVEATGYGNVIVQLIGQNELANLEKGCQLIEDYVEFEIYRSDD